MGLTITTKKEQLQSPRIKVDSRLYLNADKTRLVEEGDPEASFLYCVAGASVPADEFERLGGTIVDPDEAKEDKQPAADKEDAGYEDKSDGDDDDEGPDYESMSYRELQQACKDADLPASGSTDELLERLKES